MKLVIEPVFLFLFILLVVIIAKGSGYDLRRECPNWARTGECQKNPVYMQQYCRRSCSVYQTSNCVDRDRRCPTWRLLCTDARNAYVRSACRKTCQTCKRAKPPPHANPSAAVSCRDIRRECQNWARKGECDKNPLYMLRNCQLSCSCCQDSHVYCNSWKRQYGCRNMNTRRLCKKSCRTCGSIPVKKKPSGRHQNKQKKTKETRPTHQSKKPSQHKRKKKPTHEKRKHTTTAKPMPSTVTTLSPPSTGFQRLRNITCGTKFEIRLMIGGRRANVAEWPWMVGIARKSDETGVFCGGSIIDSEWILTAAHCWMRYPSLKAPDYVVRVSDLSLNTKDVGEEIIGVRSIITHTKFDPTTFDNDISLIRLIKPITYSATARPICLPDQDSTPFADGTKCTAAGWGVVQEDGEQADFLQVAELPLANRENCTEQYKKVKNTITGNMICAGNARGLVDACQGDSGSPLFCRARDLRFVQVGVVSWGKGCARIGFPGVYTKVSKYRKWIENAINNASKN